MSRLSVWKVPAVAVLLVWVWQLVAYRLLVPRSGLAYGWFKTPAGHAAGVWVLSIPVWTVLVVMASDAVIGSVQIWKAGRRSRIAGLLAWCVILAILGLVPSLFLDFQGNASIFI